MNVIPQQGEVWAWSGLGASHVAVVSRDSHNDAGLWPLIVLIRRRAASDAIDLYAVPLADGDPVGGVALAATVMPGDPEWMAKRQGILIGGTLDRLLTSVKTLFEMG